MRRSLLTIAAACMWFAGTNVMAMGTPVEVAAAAEGDDCSNPIAVNQGMYTPIKANHPTWFKINLVYPGLYSATVHGYRLLGYGHFCESEER